MYIILNLETNSTICKGKKNFSCRKKLKAHPHSVVWYMYLDQWLLHLSHNQGFNAPKGQKLG